MRGTILEYSRRPAPTVWRRTREIIRPWLVPTILVVLAAMLTVPWTFWVGMALYDRERRERTAQLATRVKIHTSSAWYWQSPQQVLQSLKAELLGDEAVQAVVFMDEQRAGFVQRHPTVPIPKGFDEVDRLLNADPNSYRQKFEWSDRGRRKVIYLDLSQAKMRQHFYSAYWPLLKKLIALTFTGFIVVSAIGIFAYRIWGRAWRQRQRSELEQQGLLAERGLTAAVLAHEIRNPLAALRFQLHSLKRAAEDPQRVGRTAETIDAELMRIQHLVQDYLAHEKAQTLRVAPVPLDQAVRGLQTLMGELLRDSNVRLVVDLGPTDVLVACDPHALRQVLMNLVLNAQQAMGRGGLITITIGEEDGFGTISVSDTGPGIPEEMKERLFKPFATSKQGGSGIGLALVKRFVDNFGGSVSVESEPGKGATFKLKLPLAHDPGPDEPAPAATARCNHMNDSAFHVLLVEDDPSVRDSIAAFLRDEGYSVDTAVDGQQAMDRLATPTDLVIADLMMPKVTGQELLKWTMQNHPGTAVILMTGFGTIPQAVEAIKAGATAYLTKPLDPGELLVQVKKALEDKRIRQELSRLRGQLREGWHYRHIIGQSPSMQQVFALIDRAAAVKATVLIVGESGTGKEMVARSLHEAGPRKGAPFLALNCGAIPENLIESTLFGHERGAFTGAEKTSRGYFQAANGGSLLLDEIGELPLGMQSKLLRVLEDGAVTPVGTTAPQRVDVRIVAATNRDLEHEAKEGRFRQDLYFRLNVVKIKLPSLRERKEDLPLLTRYFLDEICRSNAFEPREIDPSLLEAFENYDWPGNVRELRNTLESLVVLSGRRVLTAEDLPEKFFARSDGEDRDDQSPETDLNLARISKETLVKALETCHGNRTEAAKQLGISRRTLHRRLNEFGLRE